jgi:hypothetical protein
MDLLMMVFPKDIVRLPTPLSSTASMDSTALSICCFVTIKGGGPKSLMLWLLEKTGEVHEIEAEVMRNAKMPFSGSIEKSVSVMHETLARYRMGGEYGYGIAEYLMREV